VAELALQLVRYDARDISIEVRGGRQWPLLTINY